MELVLKDRDEEEKLNKCRSKAFLHGVILPFLVIISTACSIFFNIHINLASFFQPHCDFFWLYKTKNWQMSTLNFYQITCWIRNIQYANQMLWNHGVAKSDLDHKIQQESKLNHFWDMTSQPPIEYVVHKGAYIFDSILFYRIQVIYIQLLSYIGRALF